jgi:hypothetical protein
MDIFSKATFYDIITLLFPSAFICCIIAVLFPLDECLMACTNNVIGSVTICSVLMATGLIIKQISVWVFDESLNSEERIKKAYKRHKDKYKCVEKEMDYQKYVAAYNKMLLQNEKNPVEVLEGHVAFLRSWIIASVIAMLIIILDVVVVCCCVNCCCMRFDLIILGVIFFICILSVPVMYQLQDKIFSIVFEKITFGENKKNAFGENT